MNQHEQELNDDLQPWLQSIKGMRRAQAPDGLFNRVIEQMNRPVIRMVPVSRIRLVAASIALLIGLNIWAMASKGNGRANAPASVMEYYGTSSEYGFSY